MKLFKSMKIPMYYKITLAFVSLIVMLMAMLVISGYVAQRSVETYLRDKMEDRYELALEEWDQVLLAEGWSLQDKAFQNYLNDYSLRHELRFELRDTSGALVYSNDDILKKPGKLEPDITEDEIKFKGIKPKFIQESVPMTKGGETIGTVELQYFDARFMSPSDISFFDRITVLFRRILFATFVICLIVSFYLARSITVPLKKVGSTANQIGGGDLKARVHTNSNVLEIESLGEAINKLAETLEVEDTLRKQLTSDMAHEIRTPITALRNFFEAFIDGVYEPNEENMTKCHEEIVRMSELVDRLKDIANIEERNVVANISTLDVSEEVSSMVDLLRPEFQKKDITLSLALAGKITAEMDQNHLRQMITNLLTNAKRYTDEGGAVNVVVKEGDQAIELVVEDTGIGMSPEDSEMIFERFYRADKSRNRATGGMGVGLTIVKKLVDIYDGTIQVESTLGLGSKFTVTLPKK